MQDKLYVGLCVDYSQGSIPRVTGSTGDRKMSRDELVRLTDDIRFAMMLLMPTEEDRNGNV